MPERFKTLCSCVHLEGLTPGRTACAQQESHGCFHVLWAGGRVCVRARILACVYA